PGNGAVTALSRTDVRLPGHLQQRGGLGPGRAQCRAARSWPGRAGHPLPAGGPVPGAAHAADLPGHPLPARPGSSAGCQQRPAARHRPDRGDREQGRLGGRVRGRGEAAGPAPGARPAAAPRFPRRRGPGGHRPRAGPVRGASRPGHGTTGHRGPGTGDATAGGGAVTWLGRAADASLDALVVPGFSRIGLAVRSALLPGFTVGDYPRIDGRTVVVTGATSGIGYAAAVALARRGAVIHFLARDPGRAERAKRGIAAASGASGISYGLGDLEDLNSVRAFADEFRATHDRLDVLIHNAGMIHPEFRTGLDGTELTVLGQVVAPYLLTRLLMPALLAAAPSRVITVSSGGMYTQRLDPAILQLTAAHYRGVTAYARAKRAQAALSREWARRLPGVA